jgi:integrase
VPFGEWKLTDIVTDTIERFREARRAMGTGSVGTNRHLGTLRAMWNWALRTGYVDTNPFVRHGQAVVKLADEPSRSRRLLSEEEKPLLAACGDHLRACVEAALETGMRQGEILSLQWREVVGMTLKTTNGSTMMQWEPRAEIVLLGEKTKTRAHRRVPISSRLKAILEMRRLDPAGKPFGPDAYVFGNAVGELVGSIKRAWATAVLRAHGHAPKFIGTGMLDEDARAKLAEINLHFHDLRREAGSRWLEGGVPLHVVRDWLGHTSIAQTSTYLSSTINVQHDAMAAFEKARKAAVQKRANSSRKPGHSTPSGVSACEEKPNNTTQGYQGRLM